MGEAGIEGASGSGLRLWDGVTPLPLNKLCEDRDCGIFSAALSQPVSKCCGTEASTSAEGGMCLKNKCGAGRTAFAEQEVSIQSGGGALQAVTLVSLEFKGKSGGSSVTQRNPKH